MSSPRARTPAIQSRSSSTPTVFPPTRWSASPRGRTCRNARASCPRHAAHPARPTRAKSPLPPPPTPPPADPRVRIFTGATPATDRQAIASELPFAGHPTLGTCHAWLASGGRPHQEHRITQECGAGLVPIRRTAVGLAFAAPPLLRSGPVDESLVAHITDVLRIQRSEIIDAAWADNGPGW